MKIRSLLVVVSLLFPLLGWAETGTDELVRMGQRIYREGILPSGQPLQSSLQGEVLFSGAQAACIRCHRRSGLGSVEGGTSVLPVTGTALYQPGPAGLWQKFNFTTKGNDVFRPAYTDASLSKAIREGLTPTGRTLKPPMSQFNLGDEDMKALIAYIKTMSSSPSTGVDDKTMHWATVITPDADPEQRKVMQAVIEAYLKDKNTETRGESRRRKTSKEVMYTSYRKIDWQVWQLQGAPETWGEQLAAKYRKQPVFALVSGLGGNNWQPVDQFCQQQEVPCLFPNADVPVSQADNFFSLYFSRGLALEADVLGKYLTAQPQSGPILQVFRDLGKSALAAAQFRQSLQAAGQAGLKQRQLGNDETLDARFWAELIKTEAPATLVLWLDDKDLAALDATTLANVKLYLSASLNGEQIPSALKSATEQVQLVSSWDTEQARQPRVARTRVWMQTRQLPFSHEILQANTFWALLATTDAVKHLGGNFSPSYLIERLEDMTESLGVTSIYPRLSLGPGQRYAAKSAHIVKFEANGSLKPVSDWIIP